MPVVGHFEFDTVKTPKTRISFYSNGLAIWHGLQNIGHVKMNNGDRRPLMNLIDSKFFKMHLHLKSHISFYSNGLAI